MPGRAPAHLRPLGWHLPPQGLATPQPAPERRKCVPKRPSYAADLRRALKKSIYPKACKECALTQSTQTEFALCNRGTQPQRRRRSPCLWAALPQAENYFPAVYALVCSHARLIPLHVAFLPLHIPIGMYATSSGGEELCACLAAGGGG